MTQKENNFSVEFGKIEEFGAPFINVGYVDKNGDKHTGVMLIDTGSTRCVLNNHVAKLLPQEWKKEDAKETICSVQGIGSEFYGTEFQFCTEDGWFKDVFFANDETKLPDNGLGDAFIGILGYEFLKKYMLVLDFDTSTLHMADGDVNVHRDDYHIICPLCKTLSTYKLPIVVAGGENGKCVMVADSGCNMTTITKYVVDKCGIGAYYTGKTDSVNILTGSSSKNAIADIQLDIHTATDNAVMHYTDNAIILSEHQHIIEPEQLSDSGKLHPISGLLSAPFMARHKWILDFATQAIYTRKTA